MSKPDTENKAFLAAYAAGKAARAEGRPFSSNPYKVGQSLRRNSGTWSAVYRRYWENGWRDESRAAPPRGEHD